MSKFYITDGDLPGAKVPQNLRRMTDSNTNSIGSPALNEAQARMKGWLSDGVPPPPPPSPPVWRSSDVISIPEGTAFSHQLLAESAETITYAVQDLPAGLSYDAGTHTISGTASAPGTTTFTATASDVNGSTLQTISYHRLAVTPTTMTLTSGEHVVTWSHGSAYMRSASLRRKLVPDGSGDLTVVNDEAWPKDVYIDSSLYWGFLPVHNYVMAEFAFSATNITNGGLMPFVKDPNTGLLSTPLTVGSSNLYVLCHRLDGVTGYVYVVVYSSVTAAYTRLEKRLLADYATPVLVWEGIDAEPIGQNRSGTVFLGRYRPTNGYPVDHGEIVIFRNDVAYRYAPPWLASNIYQMYPQHASISDDGSLIIVCNQMSSAGPQYDHIYALKWTGSAYKKIWGPVRLPYQGGTGGRAVFLSSDAKYYGHAYNLYMDILRTSDGLIVGRYRCNETAAPEGGITGFFAEGGVGGGPRDCGNWVYATAFHGYGINLYHKAPWPPPPLPNQNPALTSPTSVFGTRTVAMSEQLTATGTGTITFAVVGGTLPAGLTMTPQGLISGTPTAVETQVVTLTVTSSGGTKTYVLDIVIDNVAALVITSALTAIAMVNGPFSYQITVAASAFPPTAYSATGLPTGLSINTGTGAITGQTALTGTFNVTIGATNAGGTTTAVLALTVSTAQQRTVSGLDLSPSFDGTYVEDRKAYAAMNWETYETVIVEGGNRGLFKHVSDPNKIMYWGDGAWFIGQLPYIDTYMGYASYYSNDNDPPVGEWFSYNASDNYATVS